MLVLPACMVTSHSAWIRLECLLCPKVGRFLAMHGCRKPSAIYPGIDNQAMVVIYIKSDSRISAWMSIILVEDK
jgi:hypothetical protein